MLRENIQPEVPPATQYILTDSYGNKSFDITIERLRRELVNLVSNGDGVHFHIQILPAIPVQAQGLLKQVSCLFQSFYNKRPIVLTAFLEKADYKYQIYQQNVEPNVAETWLQQLLAGNLDFTEWESNETIIRLGDTKSTQDREKIGWHELSCDQNGIMSYWHQLLMIWEENRYVEHKFFSARDVELAIEGVHIGKYQKAALEWGADRFCIFPDHDNELMVIWWTVVGEYPEQQFFAKGDTAVQAKSWLMQYLNEGDLGDINIWTDITAQVNRECPYYNQ